MGFSWTYLTRRFLFQNYRDYVAMTMIGSYAFGTWLNWLSAKTDSEYVMQRVYTDDESDMYFRETGNKTDGAVKRNLALAYAAKIHKMRAEKEREA